MTALHNFLWFLGGLLFGTAAGIFVRPFLDRLENEMEDKLTKEDE